MVLPIDFQRVKVHPVIHYLGYTLLVSSSTLLVPAIYGLVFTRTAAEHCVAMELLEYGLAYAFIGFLIAFLTRPSRRLSRTQALYLTVLTWILIPIIVAYPVADAVNIPFVDAWFESVSGFTTTGLTMFTGSRDSTTGVYVPSVEELPKTILFWRSFIQWVGGIGIVVVAITIIAAPGSAVRHLYIAEARSERIEPTVKATVKRVVVVYTIVTGLAALAMYLAGMPLFDAINHAMTGVATGGFSVKDNSIGEYHSVYIEAAAVFSMFAGALSFSDWYNVLLKGRVRRMFKNPETRALLTFTALATLASIPVMQRITGNVWEAFRQAFFQVATAITGTGFQNTDLGPEKPVAFKMLLTTLCLFGGAAFSTTGGVKQLRILIALKSVLWEAQLYQAPRGYHVKRKLAWIIVSDEDARRALAIIFAFTATMIVGTFLAAVILPDKPLVDIALETASALGNVGVSTGITGAHSPLALKLLYIALMLLGRLEILPYFYAVHSMYTGFVRWIRARRRVTTWVTAYAPVERVRRI